MKYMWIISRYCAALLSIVLISAACNPAVRRFEPTNLVWPPLPNPPKIKYVQSIYTEDDIGRNYSLKERLFGKDYDDTLKRPYSVFAGRGRILITDIGAKFIEVLDLTSKRMMVVGGDGTLRYPVAAVSDASGAIYVADVGNAKVMVYDGNGRYGTSYAVDNGKPVALAINERLGTLYVVDRQQHRVIALDKQGQQLFTFGSFGDDNGKFNVPLAIAIGADDKLYVLDSGNFRVQIFDARGEYLFKFGSVGDRAGLFANPKGIALDSEGHIYVTDAAFSNFQIFDQQGNVLLYVGSLGPAPGQMHLPGGIAIDDQDLIYVADQLNRRVEVFQYLKDAP
jgi:DNA-binding beta-propeller fold protein YncE